jgi:hypothetical protein
MNGMPYGVGQAISFQTGSLGELRDQVSLATLTLEDAKRKYEHLEAALFVAAPAENTMRKIDREVILDDARFSCEKIGASIVDQADPYTWINLMATQVNHLAKVDEPILSA